MRDELFLDQTEQRLIKGVRLLHPAPRIQPTTASIVFES